MQLRDELYTVVSKKEETLAFVYNLVMRGDCFIYKAHFPSHPVTPGVCLVQMSKELLEDALGLRLDIVGLKNVRFLSVVTPEDRKSLECRLSKIEKDPLGEEVRALAVISDEEGSKAKISLVCKAHGL